MGEVLCEENGGVVRPYAVRIYHHGRAHMSEGREKAIASAVASRVLNHLGMREGDVSQENMRVLVATLTRDLRPSAPPGIATDALLCRFCGSPEIRALEVGPMLGRINVEIVIVCLACDAVFGAPGDSP